MEEEFNNNCQQDTDTSATLTEMVSAALLSFQWMTQARVKRVPTKEQAMWEYTHVPFFNAYVDRLVDQLNDYIADKVAEYTQRDLRLDYWLSKVIPDGWRLYSVDASVPGKYHVVLVRRGDQFKLWFLLREEDQERIALYCASRQGSLGEAISCAAEEACKQTILQRGGMICLAI